MMFFFLINLLDIKIFQIFNTLEELLTTIESSKHGSILGCESTTCSNERQVTL